jgi:hypothetical protein
MQTDLQEPDTVILKKDDEFQSFNEVDLDDLKPKKVFVVIYRYWQYDRAIYKTPPQSAYMIIDQAGLDDIKKDSKMDLLEVIEKSAIII